MIGLVVTADDFGVAVAVNEAVEAAHDRGVLTAASLMVSAPAAADAVDRARRLPTLGVGLHLVLVEAHPTLSPVQIPDLVDENGRFRDDMAMTGLRIATSASVRRQLRAEIEAQFAAFAATGLRLDHVNAHKHFHIHPVIAGMVIDAAVRHGARAIRAPVEPGTPRGSGWLAAPFARSLRTRARRRGLAVPDRVFGLANTGAMTGERVRTAIGALRSGLNELYLHPATADDFPGHGPGYDHRGELAGLIDPTVSAMLSARGVQLGDFGRFTHARA